MLDESYAHLRRFTPEVLAAVDFRGRAVAAPLLEAVAILKELTAKKARKVPDAAPDSFVPARWCPYLADAVAAGNAVAYRHFWELTVGTWRFSVGWRSASDLAVQHSQQAVEDASATGAKPVVLVLVGRPQP
jgi:hypothetical protein